MRDVALECPLPGIESSVSDVRFLAAAARVLPVAPMSVDNARLRLLTVNVAAYRHDGH